MNIECPVKSLQVTMHFDPRDWSVLEKDAWIYGIICGWGDAIADVAKKHGWTDETVARLRRLHMAFQGKAIAKGKSK